ncbi:MULTISPECIES: outer membrane lipid asymmetry maintenance protein MlaD [Salinivibrio]|uniref:outer membrane lipid asymmetry maintenance protein MlaD n=1 Tax=Salinivibrio TaxID=51366 RepID=UPI000985FE50|nr:MULTISPECIES: outer membrane lipid asymmetry maintenance protein MlaD [Salinivibrio]OOF12486.1 outer membrane lipid asymmetry maintenance protein MlaD [Salinivibrio sp. PR5]OOF15141.1 outer membrane lipid asymmetry maintenance protein MlaD [Salinivibrio sp. PR919]OOF20079.1 outer membrane lipid asymmetry maintenance protein MlaD [Salinivibrio sp. IB574]OOF31568.1 outer membrane lipid asymmetry maintenance protein MlaD [Salinivibrio proteolyticus]
MQQSRKTEFWVGCFVIAGIAALLVLAFQVADVQRWGRADTYTLTAEFDNIGGLKVRSPVKVGGVTVGQVTAISLNAETYVPKVTLQINSSAGYFPESSSASIYTAGLLGEQYIGITPGFVDEALGIGYLEDGGKLEDTKSALVLEDLIGQFLYSVGDKE